MRTATTVLLLSIFLLFFLTPSWSEEQGNAEVLEALIDLPSDPSPEDIASFYSLMQCRLKLIDSVPKTRKYGVSSVCQCLGYKTLVSDFQKYLVKLNKTDKVKSKSESYKYYLVQILVLRLFMESEPDSKVWNNEVKAIYMKCCLSSIAEAWIPNTSKPRRQKLGEEIVAELERKYAISETITRMVAAEYAKLSFEGDDLYAKLELWKQAISQENISAIEEAALAEWLWNNVNEKDLLLDKIPEKFPVKGLKPGKLLLDCTRKGIFPEEMREWHAGEIVSEFKKPENRGYEYLAMICGPAIAAVIFSQEETNRAINLVVTFLGVYSYEIRYFYGSECYEPSVSMRKRVNEIREKWNRHCRLYMSGKLVEVEQGEGGACWFAGSAEIPAQKGELKLKEHGIYPVVCFSTVASTGACCVRAYEKNNAFPHQFISQTDFFKLEGRGSEYISSLTNTFEFAQTIPYDYSIEGVKAIMRKFPNNMLWTDGVGGVFSSPGVIPPEKMMNHFTPCIFYRFPRSKWTLYSIWDHDIESGRDFYERPICVLVVSPVEGDQPEEITASLMFKKLGERCKYLASTIPCTWCNSWHFTQFIEAEENKYLVDMMNEMTLALDDPSGKRWKAAIEEKEGW